MVEDEDGGTFRPESILEATAGFLAGTNFDFSSSLAGAGFGFTGTLFIWVTGGLGCVGVSICYGSLLWLVLRFLAKLG